MKNSLSRPDEKGARTGSSLSEEAYHGLSQRSTAHRLRLTLTRGARREKQYTSKRERFHDIERFLGDTIALDPEEHPRRRAPLTVIVPHARVLGAKPREARSTRRPHGIDR